MIDAGFVDSKISEPVYIEMSVHQFYAHGHTFSAREPMRCGTDWFGHDRPTVGLFHVSIF